MTLLAATAHLATKPTGAVLIVLVVSLVLFVVAAVLAAIERTFWAILISSGLAFFVLAFLI